MHVVKGQGHIWPWKFKSRGHGQSQTPWSHLRHGVQSICLLFISWQLVEIQQILYLTLKIQGQGHGQDQTWWSHLRPKIQSICLLFVSWQSVHFWLRYGKFHIWLWKYKVKVMAKAKPCEALSSINMFSFCFVGIRPFWLRYSKYHIWHWNSKSRSWPRSDLMVTFEA